MIRFVLFIILTFSCLGNHFMIFSPHLSHIYRIYIYRYITSAILHRYAALSVSKLFIYIIFYFLLNVFRLTITGHDSGYEGLPPHSDDYPEANGYIHETYGLPSDSRFQFTILICIYPCLYNCIIKFLYYFLFLYLCLFKTLAINPS